MALNQIHLMMPKHRALVFRLVAVADAPTPADNTMAAHLHKRMRNIKQ